MKSLVIEQYKTYAIAYKGPEQEIAAEFSFFNTLKQFIETEQLEDGTWVKVLRANFALDNNTEQVMEPRQKEKEKKFIVPETPGLVS